MWAEGCHRGPPRPKATCSPSGGHSPPRSRLPAGPTPSATLHDHGGIVAYSAKRRKGPITSREPAERLETGTEELLKLGSPQLHQGLFLDLASPYTGDPRGGANLLKT